MYSSRRLYSTKSTPTLQRVHQQCTVDQMTLCGFLILAIGHILLQPGVSTFQHSTLAVLKIHTSSEVERMLRQQVHARIDAKYVKSVLPHSKGCISKLQPEGVLCKHMRFSCFRDIIHLCIVAVVIYVACI